MTNLAFISSPPFHLEAGRKTTAQVTEHLVFTLEQPFKIASQLVHSMQFLVKNTYDDDDDDDAMFCVSNHFCSGKNKTNPK